MGSRRWSLIARLGFVGLLGLAVVPMSIAERRPGPQIARDETAAAQSAAAAGDVPGAERHFREALRHDPRNAQALYGLGVIEQARGDSVGSAAKFRAVIAVDPTFAEPLRNLAQLLAARPAGEAEAMDCTGGTSTCTPRTRRRTLSSAFCCAGRGRGRKAMPRCDARWSWIRPWSTRAE